MTLQRHEKAEKSWEYYRSKFSVGSRHFPFLAVLVPLIDRIRELGYAEQLYAASSLDNLVISVRPNPRDRRLTILVMPQENTVEFRLYPQDGKVEITTAAWSQAAAVLDQLLPRLTAGPRTSNTASADDKREM